MITKTHGANVYGYEVETPAHECQDTGEWIATLREVSKNGEAIPGAPVHIHVRRGSKQALEAVLAGKDAL